MILELTYVIRYRINSHDMHILLHAKQEMVSSETLLNLRAQSWARASGEGKETRSMTLKAWLPAGAKRGITMRGLFPWAGTRHLTERGSNRSGLHPGVTSSMVEIGH